MRSMKMRYKIYNLAIFIISLTIIVGIAVIWKLTATPCSSAPTIYCGADDFEHTFYPFFFSFLPLFAISLVLFFLRYEIFLTWAKFAVVSFPIMLGLLLYTYNNEPGLGSWISGANDDAQIASGILPVLFLLLSLLIIAVKFWKLRGR